MHSPIREPTAPSADDSIRVAVIWPRPRAQRWLGAGPQLPDQSDALRFLEPYGFQIQIEDSTTFPWNPLATLHEFWSGLDPARAIRLWLRSGRYELVIGVGDAVAWFPMLAKRYLGWTIPFVLIDPALSHEYPRRQRLQDFVLPRCSKVIVFGRVQLDYLRQRYGDQVDAELVLHRADTDFYCPAEQSANSVGDYFVSVGGDKSRDFATLIAAVEIARRTIPGLRGVIKTHLEVSGSTAAVQVDRSRMSWVELRELYRQARFVVLPLHDSLHAGGINTLVEAMSIAKGVIVSDSRGIRDYVQRGKTACVVAPADPAALAAAMVDFWQQPSTAMAMGQQARAFVVEHFDNRVYAAQLAAILRKVVARRWERLHFRQGRPVLPQTA